MNKQELRIGNFVHLKGYPDVEFPLSERRALMVLTKGYEVEAIPLNEEWLNNFGLKCVNLDDCEQDLENGVGRWKGDKLFQYIVATYFNEYSTACYITREIEFVHQLQNMYFAHVQSELIYKT